MKKNHSFWRSNGLSLVLFTLFLLFVLLQTIAGWHDHNTEALLQRQATISLGEYMQSGDYFEALFENWESEFLQMGAYVMLTTFLFQRGSSESKDPDGDNAVDEKPEEHRNRFGVPGPVKVGGWKLALYKHSLSLAFFGFFLLSFMGHLVGGSKAYSDDLKDYGHPAVSPLEYLTTSRFWFESMQNWQSEFLAMVAIVILSIYLREQGSPESKPVASPHFKTGSG